MYAVRDDSYRNRLVAIKIKNELYCHGLCVAVFDIKKNYDYWSGKPTKPFNNLNA